MAEPKEIQMRVTVTHGEDEVTVELNPDDLIELREDETINTVNVTMAGERIAQLQRFAGPIPGLGDTSGLN